MSTITHLDQIAASDGARRYKREGLALLDLRDGLRVLDVGCGPGTDLPALADAVGPGGGVVGLDNDPVMLAAATERCAGLANVLVQAGDAHRMPLPDGSVDRARTDRVLQHVAAPTEVLAELRRVLRPGGLALLAEPDWDTLVIDDEDLATSRAYTRYVTGQVVRNAVIGRQLGRLCGAAGFTVEGVVPVTVVFREFAAGERVLRVADVTGRAVAAGAIGAEAGRAWLKRLRGGAYLASATIFLTVARRP